MPGLFGTLNISNRGMSVQQKAIDVTSHNIANANTEGYSRQRAVIETTTPYAMPAFNNAAGAGQMGTGSQVSAIERFRDSFLDYQTRVETSTKGQYDTRENILGDVETIFNEPSDTGLSSLMSKFYDSWQQLSKQPQSSDARTVVAQQSAALADDLNNKYQKLMQLKQNTQLETKNTVVDINSQLSQIADLNKQIMGVAISGNSANDLMDKRDLLIDNLSSEFNINVTSTKLDGLNISPTDTTGISSPNMVNSVTNGTEKRISYISDIKDNGSGNFTITYAALGDTTSAANTHTLQLTNVTAAMAKNLDENRTIWANSSGVAIDSTGAAMTDSPTAYDTTTNNLQLFSPSDGVIKGYSSSQKDIDDYVDQLNNFAKALAFSVNEIHSGVTTALDTSGATPVAKDGMPFFVNKDVTNYSGSGNVLAGTDLTTSLAGEANITAANISINKQILTDVMQIKTRTNDDQFLTEGQNNVDGESDGARAKAIAALQNSLLNVQGAATATDRASFFSGNTITNNGMTVSDSLGGATIGSYFKDTIDRLGVQSQEAQRMVTNQETLLSNFQQSRTSLSGVSLDEEMANLVQYQHAYQANAKVISTIDSLLDVVINGLKK